MDSANLRRKDTTKGPPLRVLSLDGGGVRGYSMLIILQELMYRSFVEAEGRPPKREEIPKPADYFDLIGGTGTGGLIAIMLGRLRLDLETCMEVYVRMTKRVFETDKTIAGIPYKTTLFKASKLEEAIKACVREHTVYEDEGNDGTIDAPYMSPATGGVQPDHSAFNPMSPKSAAEVRRSMSMRSTTSVNTGLRHSATSLGYGATIWGNADASLHDAREKRTKTAVTAVYKGTKKGGQSVLLRSYESRKEPPPEFDCTIWQAGRATSATGLAFKPIQIGQSVFIDEGAGKYNPAPQLLEEAVVNEWPGRELGVLVSIGTGKRPSGTNSNQQEWWEGFIGGSVGSFAEARRRLIQKIEDCESTHVQMLNVELPHRGVPLENYCRLNVEVGVGEFGMNEWDRLSDMTINTRKYLKRSETQKILEDAAHKLAKIELVRRRVERTEGSHLSFTSDSPGYHGLPSIEEKQQYAYQSAQQAQHPQQLWPAAVELPADEATLQLPPQSHRQFRIPSNHSGSSNLHFPEDGRTVSSQDTGKQVLTPNQPEPVQRISAELPTRSSAEMQRYSPQYSPQLSAVSQHAPPIPPKTPINDPLSSLQHRVVSPVSPASTTLSMNSGVRPNGQPRPPYPDTDGPPPVVNKLRKPEYVPR